MLNIWILIIVVLALSAFFSAMELAFTASSRLRVELDRKEHPLFSKISEIFLSNPSQYLSTILVGNNIALVIYSMLMASVISSSIFVDTLISSVIVIFFAEFLPKSIVKREPHLYFRIFALPILFFYYLFYPIAGFCAFLSKLMIRVLTKNRVSDSRYKSHFNRADLQDLLDDGVKQGEGVDEVQASDLEMFQKALCLTDMKVRDCMVPRVEVKAMDVKEDINHLKSIFISTNYSRIPIYDGSVDNIIGYASSKMLFNNTFSSVSDMLLDLIYVPESFSAQQLLEDFIRNHKSLAVVIDEYGATAGIVTIEDIIEQIVGDIEDEHDEDDMVENNISEGEWLFSGRQEIDYLNEKYNLGISVNDQYDTLAGWILFNSEEVPKPGTEYELEGLNVTVVKASDNLISLVKLKKL